MSQKTLRLELDESTMNALSVELEGTNGEVSPACRTRRRLPVTFQPSNFAMPIGDSTDARRILDAAIAILDQGEDLLRALSAESYTRRVPLAFNGSIGGHYRHCLDHFASLLRGLDADEVDYDHRERNPQIESEPEFALTVTRQIRDQVEQLAPAMLNTAVHARCEVSYAHGNSPVTGSTLGREMVYAIAHAIHHFALISVMARLMEVALPSHFGVAPSTVAYQKAIVAPPLGSSAGFQGDRPPGPVSRVCHLQAVQQNP